MQESQTNDRYTVEFEVAGPLAMFARPDTGGTPTSYPLPTWSAAKAASINKLYNVRGLVYASDVWRHSANSSRNSLSYGLILTNEHGG